VFFPRGLLCESKEEKWKCLTSERLGVMSADTFGSYLTARGGLPNALSARAKNFGVVTGREAHRGVEETVRGNNSEVAGLELDFEPECLNRDEKEKETRP
jgi:hypothetical protein